MSKYSLIARLLLEDDTSRAQTAWDYKEFPGATGDTGASRRLNLADSDQEFRMAPGVYGAAGGAKAQYMIKNVIAQRIQKLIADATKHAVLSHTKHPDSFQKIAKLDDNEIRVKFGSGSGIEFPPRSAQRPVSTDSRVSPPVVERDGHEMLPIDPDSHITTAPVGSGDIDILLPVANFPFLSQPIQIEAKAGTGGGTFDVNLSGTTAGTKLRAQSTAHANARGRAAKNRIAQLGSLGWGTAEEDELKDRFERMLGEDMYIVNSDSSDNINSLHIVRTISDGDLAARIDTSSFLWVYIKETILAGKNYTDAQILDWMFWGDRNIRVRTPEQLVDAWLASRANSERPLRFENVAYRGFGGSDGSTRGVESVQISVNAASMNSIGATIKSKTDMLKPAFTQVGVSVGTFNFQDENWMTEKEFDSKTGADYAKGLAGSVRKGKDKDMYRERGVYGEDWDSISTIEDDPTKSKPNQKAIKGNLEDRLIKGAFNRGVEHLVSNVRRLFPGLGSAAEVKQKIIRMAGTLDNDGHSCYSTVMTSGNGIGRFYVPTPPLEKAFDSSTASVRNRRNMGISAADRKANNSDSAAAAAEIQGRIDPKLRGQIGNIQAEDPRDLRRYNSWHDQIANHYPNAVRNYFNVVMRSDSIHSRFIGSGSSNRFGLNRRELISQVVHEIERGTRIKVTDPEFWKNWDTWKVRDVYREVERAHEYTSIFPLELEDLQLIDDADWTDEEKILLPPVHPQSVWHEFIKYAKSVGVQRAQNDPVNLTAGKYTLGILLSEDIDGGYKIPRAQLLDLSDQIESQDDDGEIDGLGVIVIKESTKRKRSLISALFN